MHSSVAQLAMLGQLLQQHRPQLLNLIERRIDPGLRARMGAEEVLQEAYLAAQTRWPAFVAQQQAPIGSTLTPYAWLYRLTRDTLIEAWRRHSRQPRDVRRDMPWPDASSMQLGMGLVGGGTGPESAALREELRQQVRQAVGQLRENEREVLWMRHEDQLSFREIAGILEITENAATVRYARALRRFKDLWNALHPDGGSMP
jgi:RNA polymerase sigma-70 factor, ECF subfamily